MSKLVGDTVIDDDGIVTHIKIEENYYSLEKSFDGNGYTRYRQANEKVRKAFVMIARGDFQKLHSLSNELDKFVQSNAQTTSEVDPFE